jgi:tripartite-type tricarboxylate transporter receptor subunit TctC
MNEVNRRDFLFTAAAGIASLAISLPAPAARIAGPIRLVVGFAPGGAADALSRSLADSLRQTLSVTVIVDNKPGAGGRIAAEQFKSAPPDGSALLVSPASILTLSPHLYSNTRFSLERDFTPVAPLAHLDLALYAGRVVPDSVKSLDSMVKWLHENPMERRCGIPGFGATPHLAALLLDRQTRVDWDLVPYQGDAPTLAALLGGEIAVAICSLAGGVELLRSRKLRLLAVTGSERSALFPNVPTLSDAGYPEVVVEDRLGAFAPKLTPSVAVNSLSQALQGALQTKEVINMLQRLSMESASDDPGHFAKVLRADSERWAATVMALNLSME